MIGRNFIKVGAKMRQQKIAALYNNNNNNNNKVLIMYNILKIIKTC